MKLDIPRFLNAAMISSALMTTFTVAPIALQAQKSYHDAAHNDEHQWNGNEDKAYRTWAKQNHRKYVEFSKLKPEDQSSYWNWRHDHSDTDLKSVRK